MVDHKDYLSGEAPMAHHESHESLGSDEISVDGLHGALADNQPCIAHDLGGAKHNADTLANLNSKVSDATLLDDDAINALIGINVDAHAALPTVHQDAPALIATHKADASAHHAKYTDAEVRAVHSPMSINPSAFIPPLDTHNFDLDEYRLINRTALTSQYFFAPLNLPHAATLTKLTLYGYRNDALADFLLFLFRTDHATTRVIMASIDAGWTSGYSSGFDDTISSPIIDNDNYQYSLRLTLDPNDSVLDVMFTGAKIEFTG
jgi:hypothetical protein